MSVIFFVEKGLVKQYGIDDHGKEHVLQFGPEGWFVADRDSLFFKTPASYFIQALEDTKVMLLDEVFMKQLAAKHTTFTNYNTQLLHKHIRQLNNRIYQLLSATAEERPVVKKVDLKL